MDIQQIPSEAALYRAGCVEKLTQILDTNLVYVLAALAAIAFMGNKLLLTTLTILFSTFDIESTIMHGHLNTDLPLKIEIIVCRTSI